MGTEDEKIVLVIEDDPNTAALVALYLEREGFCAKMAGDGKTGLAMAGEHRPVLVILDLMLPEMDGWEVCRRLREVSEVPVIMLTARGEEVDRIEGLTRGADDYVVKPFSPKELVARVKAVLRRSPGAASKAPEILSHDKIRLDLTMRRLSVGDAAVSLTHHEYALLAALMATPGKIFTRAELLEHIYPRGEAAVIERVVDVHIGKLRQKIEPDPSRPGYIVTVRGVGYHFADRIAPSEAGG